MIGEVPTGAPLRCRLGWHTGQDRGGLEVFTCSRCKGSFWQTRSKYLRARARVRELEAAGDDEAALRLYHETMPKAERID